MTPTSSQCWTTLESILVVLKIIFVDVIPGAVFVGLAFGLFLGLVLGISAGCGAAAMVIGNAVLSATHMSGYTSNAHAAAIGATGACISALIIGFLLSCVCGGQDCPWYIELPLAVLSSTLAGVLGCAILRHNGVDLGEIDIPHSAAAGALGGFIFSFGTILVWPIFMAATLIILSPLFLAMTMGLKWVYRDHRSSSSWEQSRNWTRTNCSHCICCRFWERDEEIDAELAL